MINLLPYLPLVLWIIGVVVYALAVNPKAAEVARLVFMIAFFVWLFRMVRN